MKPIKLKFTDDDKADISYDDADNINEYECFGGAMCRNLEFKKIRIDTNTLTGTYDQYWCKIKSCPVADLKICPDNKWIKLTVPVGYQNIGATFKIFEALKEKM